MSGLREIKLAAAFACGSLGLCFASFSAISWLTKPLAGIGLALGVFGCWLPARKHGHDWRLPSAVVGLSAVVLAFVGSWSKVMPVAPPAPLVAVSLDPEDLERHTLDNDQWTDAGSRAVSLNDLRVRVAGARVENVTLVCAGGSKTTPEKHLVIRLHVSYEGIVFKEFKYKRWADGASAPSQHRPVLVDDENQPIEQARFGAGWSVPSELAEEPYVIYGRPLDDVLVFPAPARLPAYWHLTLPASALGQAGEYKFRIPSSMVESNP